MYYMYNHVNKEACLVPVYCLLLKSVFHQQCLLCTYMYIRGGWSHVTQCPKVM